MVDQRMTFQKVLSANDTGETGSHQAGIAIPKKNSELLEFLGPLDSAVKNPRKKLSCTDETGQIQELQFIHYNNKLHDPNGTRNEYRLTHLTNFLRMRGAESGDIFEISRSEIDQIFVIKLIKSDLENNNTCESNSTADEESDLSGSQLPASIVSKKATSKTKKRVNLTPGWKRIS